MKLEHTNSPKAEDIEFLSKKLAEVVAEHVVMEHFAFFIRDDEQQIIAGCNGYMILGEFSAIHTHQLWVCPNNRKQGLASDLLEKVHEHGRLKGCNLATLTTLSFLHNAIKLYQDLGYKLDLDRHDEIHGASCLFLRRNL